MDICHDLDILDSIGKVVRGGLLSVALPEGKDISDVLNMTIDEAVKFFENIPAINKCLLWLQELLRRM